MYLTRHYKIITTSELESLLNISCKRPDFEEIAIEKGWEKLDSDWIGDPDSQFIISDKIERELRGMIKTSQLFDDLMKEL